ncbi:hypothetical protein REPUB_Repub20aG0035000 [Reevesia pubescens]
MMQLDPSISSSIPIPIPSEQLLQVEAITHMDRDLFKAAEAGDMKLFDMYQVIKKDKQQHSVDFLQKLVDKCPSLLMQSNANREIPLHIAARHGHSHVVKFLIESTKILQSEDLEKGLEATRMREMLRRTDEEENTAFHRAAEYGHLDVLRLLIKEVDLDFAFSANTSGQTPLYIAARGGYHDLVAEILKHRKSVAYGGPLGRTVLHAAVMARDGAKSVKQLIEAKEYLTKETDDKGRTPLHYAAHLGHRSVAKLLLQKDVSAAYITDKDRGVSALHMAAWRGEIDIMEDIISYSPDCCLIVDKRGWNFLHFLVVTLPPFALKRFLNGNKVEDIPIRILLDAKDVNGYTPIHVMIAGPASQRSGFHRVCNFLLKGGFGVYSSNLDFNFLTKEKKKHIRELLNEIGNNAEVAGIPVDYFFRKNVEDWEDEIIRECIGQIHESHLVVATLVATVTFTSAFTVPGGYKSDKQGTATLSRDSAFQAFIITNTIAFVSSLLAILLHFITLNGDCFQHRLLRSVRIF